MNKELLETLKKLITLETDRHHPQKIAVAFTYIRHFFSKTPGAKVRIINNNGALSAIIHQSNLDWTKAEIILSGHIDVIPASKNSFAPYRKKGKMYGRGVADMKGGIAVMLFALRDFFEQNERHSNIIGMITSDEEIGGTNGTKKLTECLTGSAKLAIVLDGPRTDTTGITTRQKGGLHLEIIATGKSAHASRPWLGLNALDLAINAAQALQRHIGEPKPDAWQSTFNLGSVSTTNQAANVVPSQAHAIIDIRFTEELAKNPEVLTKKLRKIVPEVRLNLLTGINLLATNVDNPLVERYRQTASKIAKREVPFTFSHGASDGRFFSQKNIPTIVIGPVGGNWHAENEWVSLSSLDELYRTITTFIRHL